MLNMLRKDLMSRLLSVRLNRWSLRWRSAANWARRMVGKPDGRMRRNLNERRSGVWSENLLRRNWYSRCQRRVCESGLLMSLRSWACPSSRASICWSESRWCMMALSGRDCATCCIASLLTPKPNARQRVT